MTAGTLATALLVGAACGSLGAAQMIRRTAAGRAPLDLPDDRRLHTVPTPRGGGIGFVFAGPLLALLAATLAGPDRGLGLVVALVWALPNGIMGVVDDHRPLRPRVKFAIQIAFAVAAAAAGLRLESVTVPPLGTLTLGALGWPFTVLWLVWMANVFNFMDGMDALAAGCGALFLAVFALFAGLAGALGLAALALGLAGALAAFLFYNRPPARIFMGDGGSLSVGASLGGIAVALASAPGGKIPFAAPVLVLGTFLWDTIYTISWRALRGEAGKAHRSHLYQRLVLAGMPGSWVRGIYFGLTALAGLGAFVLWRGAPFGQGLALAVAAACALGLVALTRRTERRR